MKKKYLQLPRGYLSQSQVALWLRNPEQYKKLYFDGRDELRFTNPGMNYGKLVADALEHQTETGDLLTDAAMLLLPKYDIRDEEFRAEMKTDAGWVVVLAKPDFMNSETKDLIEIKTGRVAWTQEKADKHLQLKWYATAVYLKYDSVIPKVKLAWVETSQDTEGVVSPTGRIESFDVDIKLRDILDTMALISKVAKEIQVAWSAHETNPEFVNY